MTSLFDLQVNGFAGVDFQDPNLSLADLQRAVEGLRRHQTERFLLTLITDSVDALASKLERIEELCAEDAAAASAIAGYHLEGPYLSALPGYSGAHPPEKMKDPDPSELEAFWKAANGRIKLITLAPERPGSAEFIREAAHRGIVVSMGHTNATDQQIDAAVDSGATMCTHLGNGCPGELPRHDNIIQRLLARDELYACFIPDGIHISPSAFKNYVRAKPREKVLLTTDCMSAAGGPPGRYRIAGIEVEVGEDRVVRQPGKPNFAGSALEPDRGVEKAAAMAGWSVDEACEAFSRRAARLFAVDLPEVCAPGPIPVRL